MTIQVIDGTEVVFERDMVRFSIMESMLSAQLVGGYVQSPFRRNKLYEVVVSNGDEVIQNTAEFVSYNYNVQSMYKIDPVTNTFVLDGDGNRIVENARGENSLLFKVF
ncbi:MAG: hypothetical protein VB025_04615 [Sphaerochaeta sp.]|uniref:hypothetical protein n=1 Tax=Sphaerochaeta associata TaxID=1129264 RepID=UPI002B216DFB|nr:hypothetical protein [Sphaerochaeta associata]MEA5030506.1 hypothetical protein [Sphaerochaeta associata]MEA5031410.1 hypothetical protein [Sphaerochaeta sp.]